MKLIILQISPYKEKDGIITAFNEEKTVTFKVHGIFSPKSKFALINNSLSIIDATFAESKNPEHLTLKEASLIHSPLSGDMSIDYLTGYTILMESSIRLIDIDEKYLVYQDLVKALIALKNKVNPYLVALKYLLRVISLTGYALDVNHCVRCGGKKGIVAFSFIEGGFICQDCFTKEDKNDLDVKEMMLLRNIYLYNDYAFSDFNYEEKVVVSLLKKMNLFLSDAYGSKLNVIETI